MVKITSLQPTWGRRRASVGLIALAVGFSAVGYAHSQSLSGGMLNRPEPPAEPVYDPDGADGPMHEEASEASDLMADDAAPSDATLPTLMENDAESTTVVPDGADMATTTTSDANQGDDRHDLTDGQVSTDPDAWPIDEELSTVDRYHDHLTDAFDSAFNDDQDGADSAEMPDITPQPQTQPVRAENGNGPRAAGAQDVAALAQRAQGDPEWEDSVIARIAAGNADAGFLDRQASYRATQMLLQQQEEIGQAINRLIKIYGPNAEIEVAPGVYQSFSSMPTARDLVLANDRQTLELEMQQMEQEAQRRELELELEERQADLARREREANEARVQEEIERERAAREAMERRLTDEIARLNEEGTQRPALQTPSHSSDDDVSSQPSSEAENTAAQTDRNGAAPTLDRYSLREVYGLSGDLRAIVLTNGGDRIRLRRGDQLGDDVTVAGIGTDYIEFAVGHETHRLTLRD